MPLEPFGLISDFKDPTELRGDRKKVKSKPLNARRTARIEAKWSNETPPG